MTNPDEPFGRQPEPVKITLSGDPRDCEYWLYQLMRRAEFKGDLAVRHTPSFVFTIYPRANND